MEGGGAKDVMLTGSGLLLLSVVLFFTSLVFWPRIFLKAYNWLRGSTDIKMSSGFTLNTDTKDDHDFLYMDYSSKRARMSCGHTVTKESLIDWCEQQLKDEKDKFHCGVCKKEWSFEEVSKLVPENTRTNFDEKLFLNSFPVAQVKSCPGCKLYVKRRDTNNLSVYCQRCTSQKGKTYEFCWQCLREWKGPRPRSDRCDNDGCTNVHDILRTCKVIEFKDSGLKREVKGCPSVRACPTCGYILQHNSERCKNIGCPRCKVEFCFVCLKVTKDCLKTSSFFIRCSSGVAPRQTSIPTWSHSPRLSFFERLRQFLH